MLFRSGIQVASLAGVPEPVIARAYEILRNIERGEFNLQGQPNIAAGRGPKKSAPQQLALFSSLPGPALHLLAEVDPDQLTPKQALDLVYELLRVTGPAMD